jgi:hypothetical protein
MKGTPLGRPKRKRTMMARCVLHGVSSLAGVFAMQTAHAAPMWVRMILYGLSWLACAALYVPILYLREHLVDAWDERTRRILRDELDRRELMAYQRGIDSERMRQETLLHDGGRTRSVERDDGSA